MERKYLPYYILCSYWFHNSSPEIYLSISWSIIQVTKISVFIINRLIGDKVIDAIDISSTQYSAQLYKVTEGPLKGLTLGCLTSIFFSLYPSSISLSLFVSFSLSPSLTHTHIRHNPSKNRYRWCSKFCCMIFGILTLICLGFWLSAL